ncbi:secreted protein [Paraphaeosphaeria minitans]|uniref:Secreted protein n=1 Tax=Paraphaeosphaeria minitans TaxID=565426 RepID=A0A9P6GPI8_9PLEO|nr:secreted protein [Paraphaeosphaeria minitans]
MRSKSLLLLLLPTLALAAPAPLPIPQDKPSGHEVEITAVTYGGTGCPDKTVQGLLSDDKTTITLSFDQYTVQSGPNIPATERRKFCQLQLKLNVFGADYRGYASLEKDVTGTAQSTYYFSGQQNQNSGHPPSRANTPQTVIPTNFKGPMEGNYLKHDEIDAGSTVWSPCGEQGMLNIKSEVRIVPFTAKGLNLLTVDTVDAKFSQKYYVQWQRCEGKSGGGSGGIPIGRPPMDLGRV